MANQETEKPKLSPEKRALLERMNRKAINEFLAKGRETANEATETAKRQMPDLNIKDGYPRPEVSHSELFQKAAGVKYQVVKLNVSKAEASAIREYCIKNETGAPLPDKDGKPAIIKDATWNEVWMRQAAAILLKNLSFDTPTTFAPEPFSAEADKRRLAENKLRVIPDPNAELTATTKAGARSYMYRLIDETSKVRAEFTYPFWDRDAAQKHAALALAGATGSSKK